MVEKIKRGEERPRKRAPSHDLCQTHSSLIQGDFEKGKNPIDLAPLFLRLDLRKTEPAVSPWLFSSERFPFQGRREGERASEREKARGNTLQFEERKETSSRAKREELENALRFPGRLFSEHAGSIPPAAWSLHGTTKTEQIDKTEKRGNAERKKMLAKGVLQSPSPSLASRAEKKNLFTSLRAHLLLFLPSPPPTPTSTTTATQQNIEQTQQRKSLDTAN